MECGRLSSNTVICMYLITLVWRSPGGQKAEMTYRLSFPFDRGQSDWAVKHFRENVARVATMSTFSVLHGECAITEDNVRNGRVMDAPVKDATTEVFVNCPGPQGPASIVPWPEALALKESRKASHWLHKKWSENQWVGI